jgi:hypothetical protein
MIAVNIFSRLSGLKVLCAQNAVIKSIASFDTETFTNVRRAAIRRP